MEESFTSTSSTQSKPERPMINAAMARRASQLQGRNSITNSPGRRISVTTFFRAGSPLKSKGVFMNILRDSPDSTPSTPGLWDPRKESRLTYVLKKERKSRKDAELIHETIKTFAFYNQFVESNLTELGEEAILHLCKEMKHEWIGKGNYVVKEGDASNDKFYIILSGKASVIFNKEVNVYAQENIVEMLQSEERDTQDRQELKEPTSPVKIRSSYAKKSSHFATHSTEESDKSPTSRNRESPTNKSKFLKIVPTGPASSGRPSTNDESSIHEQSTTFSPLRRMQTTIEEPVSSMGSRINKKLVIQVGKSEFFRKAKEKEEGEELNLNVHGTINKILEKGYSFGEKALTNPGAKRSASIYTLTDCEFIIVMKKDFLAVFNRFSKANNQKLGFLLSTVPNLNKISSKLILEDYMYSVQIADANKGTVLTEQGKTGERIYFIANGFCTLEREVECPNIDPEKNILAKRKLMVQVARLGPNMLIGEELLFGSKKEKKYRYTAKVDSTETLIYYMKANEMQLKFPKDALQGLRQNFQKKEACHQLRIDELLQKKAEKSDFYSEFTSMSVKNIFENMRPASCKKSLIKTARTEALARAIDQSDKQENQRLVKSRSEFWQSISSREVMSVHPEVHAKHNPTIENYYEDLREAKERRNWANLTASTKICRRHNETVSSEETSEESAAEDGKEQNNVFELTSLGFMRNDNEHANTQRRGLSIENANSKDQQDSLVKVISYGRAQNQQNPGRDEAKSHRRRMGVGSAEQLKYTIINSKLEVDTTHLKQKSMISLEIHEKNSTPNAPKTAGYSQRRMVKFSSSSVEGSHSLQTLNESKIRNEQSLEVLPEAEIANSPAEKKKKIRSVSARAPTQREKKSGVSMSDLPNKRNYVIRQRESARSNQDVTRRPHTSQGTITDNSKKSSADNEIVRFDFGVSERDEADHKAKQKALLRRMLESKRIIHHESRASGERSNLNASRSSSPLTILKALISPRKDELYQKLAQSLVQTPQYSKSGSLGIQTQSIDSLLINAKDLDSPLNINSYQSTNYHGLSSHTRTTTLNDSKSSISGSLWHSQSRGKLLLETSTSQYSRGLKDLSSPVIKRENSNNTMSQTTSSEATKRLFSPRKVKLPVGAALSLQIRKKMYDSLRFSKKSVPWKEPFKREESAKTISRPSGPVILEVKSMVYEQDQDFATWTSRMGE